MRKKRILIFSTSYSPFWGGAEIALKEITNRLADTKGGPLCQQRTALCDDYCFDMITMRHDKALPKFEKVGNINVYRVASSKLLFLFFAYLKALTLHRKNKYDIVWSMMAGRNAFGALFFKLTHKKVKYLLTLQEGDRLSYPKERAGMLWFAVSGLFKKVFTKADFVQVISKYLREWARDMGYKGKIAIVPNGADIEKFKVKSEKLKVSTEKLKKDLGIQENEKVIITTSRLVEKNAVEDIIRALTFLPNNYKLLIAGTGELFYKLRKLTDELRLTKRALFLGHIEHSELPKYLHIADIFVRPSLSEGLGSSFIEAMTAGAPVIATKVGGITDFLIDRKTGLFCGIHDPRGISEKIELLMKDNTLRESIINNALEMVEKTYDWNLIAKNMKEKVFDKLEISASWRKNILIATGIFPPDIGGPATYSKLLLDELPRHNLNIEVLSFGEVKHLPKIIRHIAYFFKVLNRGKRADIIYAQDPVSVGLPSALASKLLRKKFLLKVVGDYAWEQMQVQSQKLKVKSLRSYVTPEEFQTEKYDFKTEIRRKIERFVAKRANKIIVPSKYLKKIVSMWGVDEENIEIIYNGIKNEQESGNKETVRALLQFEGKLIISIGRLVPWKGFDTLIKIFPEIKNKFKDVKLIIVGSGPDKEKLQDLINKKGLKENVALTGVLQKDILLRYIKASDLFVLNTGYEGFSHQILEVMDVGVPIVTTYIGGNSEIIQNGKNGLTVSYNDEKELKKSILKLLDDKKYADKLAKEAKEKVKEFSEEKMIKNTAEMLKII